MQNCGNSTDRTYVNIDINALRHNIELGRAKAGGAKVMCLVKADAYGHGAVEVAKYCSDLLDYLGVATVDEGIELRRAGIALPILVVGDVANSRFADAVRFDIELTAHSRECAVALNEFCKSTGARAKVHIAVDTGMGRIGFLPGETDLALSVCKLEHIEIKGIFTHFAKADERDKAYTHNQKRLFDEFVGRMRSEGADVGLRHVANSAGILEMPDCGCDMVRMGIMTYGLSPSADVKCEELQPVMSWYTHIVHVKTLPKGSAVSYGGRYVTQRDTVVATIAVGYGDGYPRALSDKARVLVRGQSAPVIGRVCMDQTMIDVTHIDGVSVGDMVTLMGRDDIECITADELARLAGTINYEIVCGISQRAPRVYVTR